MVLEVAFAASADYLVTLNLRGFADAKSATAAAEKISALTTEQYLSERAARGRVSRFKKENALMNHQADSVGLVAFSPKDDLPMVEDWLQRPHVARWWGDPEEAIAEIRKHPAPTSALILVGSTPIGYLCWQVPTHQELLDAGLADLPSILVDIDIMIGEPSALGHGLGPEALSQLLARLHDEGVQIVGMATADSNQRARRAFEKVGFRLFRAFTESGEQMRYLTKMLNAAA